MHIGRLSLFYPVAVWAWLGLAQAVAAQEVPQGPQPEGETATPAQASEDGEDLFAPLPEIPALEELPPPDFGVTPAIAPIESADPTLLAPLPPLATFDPAPSSDFQIDAEAQQEIRYGVSIEGMDETGLGHSFRRLSALKRGENRGATPAELASRTKSDEELMRRVLESDGYYSAITHGDMRIVEDGRAEIRLIAEPGARYRWREITLDLIPPENAELAQGFGLKVGDPIVARTVEEAEGALLLRLSEQGYAFAEIGTRDVVLDSGDPTGSYFLTGDIGPLSVFGPVTMRGYEPFSEKHAQVIARFRPGDLYDSRLLDDFRRALIATQQFGGVTVSTHDSGERDAEGRALTEVRIRGNRGPKRMLTGQLGYSTDEGIRAEGSWRHRGFIQPEGMLTLRSVLGTEEQRLGSQLTMSNFGQRDRTFDLSAEISNLTPPAYIAQTVAVAATLGRASTQIWQKRWTWSLGLGVGASKEKSRASISPNDPDLPSELDPGEKRTFLFISMPTWIGYDRSNDLLDPTKGYRLRLDVNPEISREGTRLETYGRFFAEGTAYQGFGDSFVLAGRLKFGTILGADLFNIAPTRRLYAGGGGSVRGYEYQGVGDLGANDRPVGGRGLFESSVEARYRFGDYGLVAFVDAGSVTPDTTPSFKGARFGAGVGGRYYTSFGPIRIDLARAIDRSTRDPKFALYISIGQSF